MTTEATPEATPEAKRLRDVRTSADPKFVYEMTYETTVVQGGIPNTGIEHFYFLEDNLAGAKAHAEHICDDKAMVFGRFISVARVRF